MGAVGEKKTEKKRTKNGGESIHPPMLRTGRRIEGQARETWDNRTLKSRIIDRCRVVIYISICVCLATALCLFPGLDPGQMGGDDRLLLLLVVLFLLFLPRVVSSA